MANPKTVKKLDTAFSLFIRLRDSKDGYFTCCSCGQLKPYAKADAGHFINRRFMATRWREDNVHAQCSYCNRFSEGDAAGYALFMLKKYGQKHLEYLSMIKNQAMKYTDFDLEIMTKDYRNRVKQMKDKL